MANLNSALLAHSIAFATAVTALFAFVGLIIGRRRQPTTYAVSFAAIGGLAALGIMGLFKLGATLGL